MSRRHFNPQRFTTDPHNLLGAEGKSRIRKLDNDERMHSASNPPQVLEPHADSTTKRTQQKREGNFPEQTVQTPEEIANTVRRKVGDAAHLGGYIIKAPNELATLISQACTNGLTAEQLTIAEAHNFIRRSEIEQRYNQALATVDPTEIANDPELASTIRGYIEAAPATSSLQDIVASARDERLGIKNAQAQQQAEAFQNLVRGDSESRQSSAQHEGMRKAAVPKIMGELSRRESIINKRLSDAREKADAAIGEPERVRKANELRKELEAFIEKIKLLGIEQPKQYEIEAIITKVRSLQQLDTKGYNKQELEQFLQYCYTPDSNNKKILLAIWFKEYYESIQAYTDGQNALNKAFSELEDVRHGKDYNYQPDKVHTKDRFPKKASVASMRPGPNSTADENQRRSVIERRQQKQARQEERDQESFPA